MEHNKTPEEQKAEASIAYDADPSEENWQRYLDAWAVVELQEIAAQSYNTPSA